MVRILGEYVQVQISDYLIQKWRVEILESEVRDVTVYRNKDFCRQG